MHFPVVLCDCVSLCLGDAQIGCELNLDVCCDVYFSFTELTQKLKQIQDEQKQVADELRNANSNSAGKFTSKLFDMDGCLSMLFMMS